MKHLNGNILAVVDVETTGVIPRHHDIIEIAVLPLNSALDPHPEILPFHITMQPARPDNIDPDALFINKSTTSDDINRIDRPVVRSRSRLLELMRKGIEPDVASELFVEWYHNLGLRPYKRICPIGHNYAFDREFIIDWLGIKSYELCFDPRYRDTMGISCFENDKADFFGRPFPYQKNSLDYLCNALKIENPMAHQALSDCLATAEVYKAMVQGYGNR